MLRRLRSRIRRGSVGLWYHPDYSAPNLAESSRAEHVEFRRGEIVLARLFQERLISPSRVESPSPTPLAEVGLFHSQRWLERAEDPEVLAHVFGLESGHIDAPRLLESVRRAVGGTVAALQDVAAGRLQVGINLGGGFHHAEPEQGSGFCVFNDVGVGISVLREAGYRGRVAIVDLDFHQGNGNSVAFAVDPSVFVYSIHGSVWSHSENPGREIHLTGPVNDGRYLAKLRTTLETELHRFRPDLIVYIAGMDVLAGDPIGSWWLTPKGVFERDAHVFSVARNLGARVVVTFGGGYGPHATPAHFQLARAALTGLWRFDERHPPTLRARFSAVAASLDQRELQGEPGLDDFRITEEDLFGALQSRPPAHRFLDYYSVHGMELVFERYGILERVRNLGFEEIDLEIDPSDPTHQIIRIRGRRPPMEAPAVLVELVCRRRTLTEPLPGRPEAEFLFIEWLLLQDPSRSFSLARPPLPGQEHPGLGLSREMQEILRQAARRLKLDGLLAVPSHYHSAVVALNEWSFLEAKVEGLFQALRAVLSQHELYAATRLVADGRLALADGSPVHWEPGDHVLPFREDLRSYLASPERREAVLAVKADLLARGLRVVPVEEANPAPAELQRSSRSTSARSGASGTSLR